MKMKKNSAFTLIELLVVIAIIGILSSVVLASVNTARARGADAAVKSNLANIRPQAEILYDTYGGYGVDATPTTFAKAACVSTADTLFANTTIWNQIQAALTAAGSGALSSCEVLANGTAWAVAVHLKTPLKAWCVDSTGTSKEAAVADQLQATLNGVITSAKCN